MTIYVSSQPDYYPINWNKKDYEAQFTLITQTTRLGVRDHHFVSLSLLEKIIQVVKGIFGFHDASNSAKVDSELMKFFHYGVAQGWVNENRLNNRVCKGNHFNLPGTKELLNVMSKKEWETYDEQKRLHYVQSALINYHNGYASQLEPNFWAKWSTPQFKSQELQNFGDTPLRLAARALSGKQPNINLAFDHFENAYELKNLDPVFQAKFGDQFLTFLNDHQARLSPTRCTQIPHILLFLISTAYQNKENLLAAKYASHLPKEDWIQQKLGEIFLKFDRYEDVRPYLPELEKVYEKDVTQLTKVGMAYAHFNDYQFMSVFSNAMNLMDESRVHQDKKDQFYLTLGDFYLQKEYSFQAIICFSRVETPIGRERLLKAFVLQYQRNTSSFLSMCGTHWKLFLEKQDKTDDKDIKNIRQLTVTCIEQTLKIGHSEGALDFLNKGKKVLGSDSNFAREVLNIDDLPPNFDSILITWIKEFQDNILIQENLGKALWERHRQEAVSAILKAIEMCKQAIPTISHTSVLQVFQEKLAKLCGKMGTHFLEKPYYSSSQAMDYLKMIPSEYHSEETRKLLSQAHIGIGKEARSETEKMSNYYKAFETCPQQGEYLIELLELQFKQGKQEEAMQLYAQIRKQPWGESFNQEFNAKKPDLCQKLSTLQC